MLYKRDVLKNFLKLINKTKKQSSGILPKDIKISKFIEKIFFLEISFLIKLRAGNLKLPETIIGDGHQSLEISMESFLIKLHF